MSTDADIPQGVLDLTVRQYLQLRHSLGKADVGDLKVSRVDADLYQVTFRGVIVGHVARGKKPRKWVASRSTINGVSWADYADTLEHGCRAVLKAWAKEAKAYPIERVGV